MVMMMMISMYERLFSTIAAMQAPIGVISKGKKPSISRR